MKTTPVTPADLGASVFAVPPLARNADLTLNRAANAAQIRHIEAGGVTSILYGGNANLFHVSVSEYPHLLDMLEEHAAPNTWMIPSVGPEFGLLMDQVTFLKTSNFPTAICAATRASLPGTRPPATVSASSASTSAAAP